MAARRTDVHADWLALCEVAEPFIAPPVARDLFASGLPKTDTALRNEILAQVDEHATADDHEQRRGWVRWLLTEVLKHRTSGTKATLDLEPDLAYTFRNQGDPVTLTPTYVVHDPGKPDQPRMLVLANTEVVLPANPDRYTPETRHKGLGWTASPVHRATRLARAADCRLALITNGRFFTLVGIHESVVGHGTWDATEFRREHVHLDSFLALLSPQRLYGPEDTQLEQLLDDSVDAQQDVTRTLGANVRRACELLVAAISRADRRSDDRLLEHVPPARVYEAAVTTVMRTVFLLTAEENGLLPIDNVTYRDHYAASTLGDQLGNDIRTGRATAQRRSSAWHRLLGLARAVHGGVRHADLSLNAYGGSLFDPDRFPFLEGRIVNADGEVVDAIDADLVDDLTMYEILQAITVVDGRPVSFRAMDVEQIGHVYESLLDHSTRRADAPVLAVIGKEGLEPEIPLADLEAAYADKGIRGVADLVEKATDKAKKKKPVTQLLEDDPDTTIDGGPLRAACGGDDDLYARVQPFLNLLRVDLRGLPMVIRTGDHYVTETTAKRDSGTAYTTRELADEIAKHALDPLIHSPGPQDTADENEWQLKSSDEILSLKICDPAIGSAAIAVAAARYLSDAVVRARHSEGEITDDQLLASEEDTRQLDVHVQARRDIVARCIYGVDMDPMAVEMAKMSLWLITMARDKPFSFLDHAIKCGNSLLGITSLDQLRRVTLADEGSTDQLAFAVEGESSTEVAGGYYEMIDRTIIEASTLRRQLRESDVRDPTDARHKQKLHRQVEDYTERLRIAADAITAACLYTATESDSKRDARLAELPPLLGDLDADSAADTLRRRTDTWKEAGNPNPDLKRRFFHWPIEFAEVFDRGGLFDAMVGNPPFLGGKRISGPHGSDFREHVTAYVAGGDRGNSDLVSYFFRRAAVLARGFGFLATNTVSQGGTREVALRPICGIGTIHRAWGSVQWPGTQGVTVAKAWWVQGSWLGPCVLDGIAVQGIESDFYPVAELRGEPFALPRFAKQAAAAQFVYGKGFIITEEEASQLIERDPRNRDVLFPYVNGEDLNKSPSHSSDRWVICFHDWSLDRAKMYPDVFRLLEERVYEERQKANQAGLRERWWRFAAYQRDLVDRVSERDSVIALARVSSRVVPVRVPTGPVYSEQVVLFPSDDARLLGLLTSSVHRVWVDRYCSTMRAAGVRYTPADGYDTFPQKYSDLVGEMADDLEEWRQEVMSAHGEGITRLYGRFHDPTEVAPHVAELRDRHRELDDAVLEAYGWPELDLRHGFHATRYGVFYTVSTEARYEVLARLLDLNFMQYAEQTGQSYEAVVKEATRYV